MVTLLLFGIGVGIVLFVLRKIQNSGYWENVVVEVQEAPELLSKSLEIFYKHYVGPYSKSGEHAKEVRTLVPGELKLIIVYYDDPKETRDDLCQSIVGVVYSIDGNAQFDEHFASDLSRWGFERMTVPAVQRAVISKQKFDGFFSYFHLVNHTYPRVKSFIDEHRFRCRLTIEVVANNELTVCCPLDHVEEFVVPEVIPTHELELKLAARRGSDSETDVSDDEQMSSLSETEDETSPNVN